MKNHAITTLQIEFERIHTLLTRENSKWHGNDRELWSKKLVELQKALALLNAHTTACQHEKVLIHRFSIECANCGEDIES